MIIIIIILITDSLGEIAERKIKSRIGVGKHFLLFTPFLQVKANEEKNSQLLEWKRS